MLAPPWRHFLASNVVITESLEPFFYKHVLAIVISMLCEDMTTASPWGDDGKWETEAWEWLVNLLNLLTTSYLDQQEYCQPFHMGHRSILQGYPSELYKG
jgi:hypothetical protein